MSIVVSNTKMSLTQKAQVRKFRCYWSFPDNLRGYDGLWLMDENSGEMKQELHGYYDNSFWQTT